MKLVIDIKNKTVGISEKVTIKEFINFMQDNFKECNEWTIVCEVPPVTNPYKTDPLTPNSPKIWYTEENGDYVEGKLSVSDLELNEKWAKYRNMPPIDLGITDSAPIGVLAGTNIPIFSKRQLYD